MGDYVIIPAHNEETTIGGVIEKVRQYTDDIIVVDDGSSDQTASIAENLGVTVLQHSVNLGKGAALKTGCDFAVRSGAQRIVVMDADGQHDPAEIPYFLNALRSNEIVFGYRKQAQSMPTVLKFGNRVINNTLKTLFRINIKDTQCGYRAFTAASYTKIRWRATDYFMETEMIVKAGKQRLTYTQVPIETIYGNKYKGTTVVDGVKIVLKMIGWRLLE